MLLVIRALLVPLKLELLLLMLKSVQTVEPQLLSLMLFR